MFWIESHGVLEDLCLPTENLEGHELGDAGMGSYEHEGRTFEGCESPSRESASPLPRWFRTQGFLLEEDCDVALPGSHSLLSAR